MYLKGIFKKSSFFSQIFILLGIVFLGIIISILLFYIFMILKEGFSMELITNSSAVYEDAGTLRILQFFNSLGTFFFPALILGYMFSQNSKTYLYTNNYFSWKITFLIIASVIVLGPFINAMGGLNGMMKLPESLHGLEKWMADMEAKGKEFTEMMLFTKEIPALILNVLIIGVIAALGEELMFRGVIQNIFRKVLRNEHLIIWIVAIIFSAIHMQFYGFIPRMLLGAYFGYLLYYTKSIWAPILAHFINNSLGVFSYYSFHDTDTLKQLDAIGTGSTWWVGVISFLLWAALFYFIIKISPKVRASRIY